MVWFFNLLKMGNVLFKNTIIKINELFNTWIDKVSNLVICNDLDCIRIILVFSIFADGFRPNVLRPLCLCVAKLGSLIQFTLPRGTHSLTLTHSFSLSLTLIENPSIFLFFFFAANLTSRYLFSRLFGLQGYLKSFEINRFQVEVNKH